MAASSPAPSNISAATPSTPSAAVVAASTAINVTLSPTKTSKNLRGLNKPKCIKCGNVARSRCPYQSCKSCCAKAQNPCHIHVLKGNANLPDKIPATSSPLFDQQSTESSPSGNSHRFTSLRQLSNNFSQFNNLQSPLRSRKPLTKKDAVVINEWRFLKLQEYKEGNIEEENEAFDRYMQNISLLEEVLAVNSAQEGFSKDGSPISGTNSTSVGNGAELTSLKLKLRLNPSSTENLRKRLNDVVNQGLRKLRKTELNRPGNELNNQDELAGTQEKGKHWRAERASALSDLLDKLNKARNEEDLKSCLETRSQLFIPTSKTGSEIAEIPKQETAKNDFPTGPVSDYSPPLWFSTANIDQDSLDRIDSHFSSLVETQAL